MRPFSVPNPGRAALRVSTLSAFVSLFLLLVPPGVSAQQATPSALPHYQVTDLGSIGAHSSEAFDLNERGHAAGNVEIDAGIATPEEGADPPVHAVLWRDGTIT